MSPHRWLEIGGTGPIEVAHLLDTVDGSEKIPDPSVFTGLID